MIGSERMIEHDLALEDDGPGRIVGPRKMMGPRKMTGPGRMIGPFRMIMICLYLEVIVFPPTLLVLTR